MKARARVVAQLESCRPPRPNWLWHGQSGLRALTPGIDHRLVERVMRAVFPLEIALSCRRLPAEYEPLAWRVIAQQKTVQATFLTSLGELRRGAEWLVTVQMVDARKRNRERLQALCANAACVEAARAAVARHGVEAEQLLSVLAHDGSDESIDVLMNTVLQALHARDEQLDLLGTWLVPFARGAGMAKVVAALRDATNERGAQSPLLALSTRFGAKGPRLTLDFQVQALQVQVGLTRKAAVWLEFDSHRKPSACASVVWNASNPISTRWEDGRVVHDKLKLKGPNSVDDLPRWIAAAAKKLRVSWDRATVRVSGSLRGKARAAAVEWLLAG